MRKIIFLCLLCLFGGLLFSCGDLTEDDALDDAQEAALQAALNQIFAEQQAIQLKDYILDMATRFTPKYYSKDLLGVKADADSDGFFEFVTDDDLLKQATDDGLYKLKLSVGKTDITTKEEFDNFVALVPDPLQQANIDVVHSLTPSVIVKLKHPTTQTIDETESDVTIDLDSAVAGVTFDFSRTSEKNIVKGSGKVSLDLVLKDKDGKDIEYQGKSTLDGVTAQEYVNVVDNLVSVPDDFCISDVTSGTMTVNINVPTTGYKYDGSGGVDFTAKMGHFDVKDSDPKKSYCYYFGKDQAPGDVPDNAKFKEKFGSDISECQEVKNLSLEADEDSPYYCVLN